MGLRKIIHGVAYDTDKAELVASRRHEHDLSDAFWSLYRKPDGTFFQIMADHDGVVDGVYPLTDRQARAWVERNANQLVERYFGPALESAAPRFSRATRIAAVDVLEKAPWGHNDLTRMFQRLGREVVEACDSGSITGRYNALNTFLDADETRRIDSGAFLQDAMVEMAVKRLPTSSWDDPPSYDDLQTQFVRALALDGFTVVDATLRPAAPEELQLPEAEDEIARLLNKHGFAITKGHLDLALTHHLQGQWPSANAQLRVFVESLFDDMAAALAPPGENPGKAIAARTWLGRKGFLFESLAEWREDSKSFVEGLMKRLHPEGAHPGLSNEDDCTFRRHIVLISARLWLVRFDAVRGARS